jgi:hypothetical protein
VWLIQSAFLERQPAFQRLHDGSHRRVTGFESGCLPLTVKPRALRTGPSGAGTPRQKLEMASSCPSPILTFQGLHEAEVAG